MRKASRQSPARALPVSPLVVSDWLFSLAQSASTQGQREAALVLLEAALALLEAPPRPAAKRLSPSRGFS